MQSIKLDHFYNDGFGWICKSCEAELKTDDEEKSRLLTEGEAESKNPKFSNEAMAKWFDESHKTLLCPRCGQTELADKK